MGQKYVVEGALVAALIGYLQERPYRESNGFINALAACPQVVEAPKTPSGPQLVEAKMRNSPDER
jgi:hypothetical protein